MYIERIQITEDTSSSKILEELNTQIKKNEQDSYDSYQLQASLEEELKKYSEPYSPYPLFLLAYKLGASDIDILAMPKDAEKKGNPSFKNDRTKIRFKIDWFWEEIAEIDRNKHLLYINAIKNWAIKGAWNLTAENQRISQDWKGILHILKQDKKIEKTIQLRIATAPQHVKDDQGNPLEKCSIRLLDNKWNLPLERSWFNKYDFKKAFSIKDESKGLVLISGPTGSWKSSTLFWMIDKTNDWSKNILSFENPVEFDVPGVAQIEVNPIEDIPDWDEITQNFSRSSEFAMRAAPDIILVWEIRNFITASTALAFANTGHVTMATIHTNSALSSLDRMMNFKKRDSKLDKFLLISSLKYISAQMLVPKLCPHCKIKVSNLPSFIEKKKEEKDIDWLNSYKGTLEEIKIQKSIIKKELLRNNVKLIPELKGISEQIIDTWIENSFIQNIDWCEKCKIRKKGEKIKKSVWRKGRLLINETLLFDSYLVNLLKEEPFSMEKIKENLLEKRPLLKPGEEWYFWENDKFSFTTLYQDALFKALFPWKLFEKMVPNIDPKTISILDAMKYWYK